MNNPRLNVAALALSVWAGVAAGAAGQATVQDKVYSAAQAKQGLKVYDEHCASCHDGGTMGPELWGDAFVGEWKGKNVSALFERIDQTMPAESPGVLSDDDVLSVIAYVLQQNGFPAGDNALGDAKRLGTVQFVAP